MEMSDILLKHKEDNYSFIKSITNVI